MLDALFTLSLLSLKKSRILRISNTRITHIMQVRMDYMGEKVTSFAFSKGQDKYRMSLQEKDREVDLVLEKGDARLRYHVVLSLS